MNTVIKLNYLPFPGPRTKENRVSITEVRYEYSIWPALRDLNPRHPESESGALSAELRADVQEIIYHQKTEVSR